SNGGSLSSAVSRDRCSRNARTLPATTTISATGQKTSEKLLPDTTPPIARTNMTAAASTETDVVAMATRIASLRVSRANPQADIAAVLNRPAITARKVSHAQPPRGSQNWINAIGPRYKRLAPNRDFG